MQLASGPHDCTTQLILSLAHCLSSDAFDPNPVGTEVTQCSVVEVELSAAKVSTNPKTFFSPEISCSQALLGAGSVLPVLPIGKLPGFSA